MPEQSTKLHLVTQAPLQELAAEIVADYRARQARAGNAEAYEKLDGLEALERLMDLHGTEWVELRAQELATARRIRGLK